MNLDGTKFFEFEWIFGVVSVGMCMDFVSWFMHWSQVRKSRFKNWNVFLIIIKKSIFSKFKLKCCVNFSALIGFWHKNIPQKQYFLYTNHISTISQFSLKNQNLKNQISQPINKTPSCSNSKVQKSTLIKKVENFLLFRRRPNVIRFFVLSALIEERNQLNVNELCGTTFHFLLLSTFWSFFFTRRS
jgi:hypothetical protein